MQHKWSDSRPIYLQLRDHAISMILDGALDDGDPLPSVRTVAADFNLNPITVSKAYQSLVEDDLVERRRGLGMFVREGAKIALLEAERSQFLERDWPALLKRARTLDIDPQELISRLRTELDES